MAGNESFGPMRPKSIVSDPMDVIMLERMNVSLSNQNIFNNQSNMKEETSNFEVASHIMVWAI